MHWLGSFLEENFGVGGKTKNKWKLSGEDKK